MNIDFLSKDCIFYIMKYMSYSEWYRLLQINKRLSDLKRCEPLWRKLWYEFYPDNDFEIELGYYNNFLKCNLVQKFLDLNSHFLVTNNLMYGMLKHSQTPKRHHNKAMVIPFVGFKWSDTRVEILPISLKQAFTKLGVTCFDFPSTELFDYRTVYVDLIISNKGLMISPRAGDIIYSWSTGLTFLFDGNQATPFLRQDGIDYLPPCSRTWPNIPATFWYYWIILPKSIIHQLTQNFTCGQFNCPSHDIYADVHTWIQYDEHKINVYFDDSGTYPTKETMADFFEFTRWRDFPSQTHDLFTYDLDSNGQPYLTFVIWD